MANPLIVAVNDDPSFLTLLDRLLSSEGYRVITWRDGATAYEAIREARPDLVILDVRLESPDAGFRVLELLRFDPATREIPALVCSADTRFLRRQAEHLRRHRAEVLEKPFDIDELLGMIARLIGPATSPHEAV